MKRISLFLAFLAVMSLGLKAQPKQQKQQKQKYDVAAYLYPAYAADDPRLRPFWPMGFGEWETVMNMQQRNPGHYWNRHPLWGYVNEADPAVMEMEIDQAADHGVNVFIFDWYWFDSRPFMETTLTNGFLKARNRDRMQFYLMWANHNVENYWDTRISKYGSENIIWRGGVDREEFERLCKRNIELFFKQPNYYKIDGKPVFMIYEVTTFIEGIGGVENAIDALKWFRKEVKKAGFPDLELQFTMWNSQFNYSGVDEAKAKNASPREEFIKKLGFNSMSHYQFCHFINVDDDYQKVLDQAYVEWEKLEKEFTSTPYYPHISIGWDNSPRTGQSAVIRDNTPERFEGALRKAKSYVDARPNLHPLITINSWNEWTETSYLQPDDVYGYGYLDAVKKVFVDE
ncbi:MAG: glycoside hydrolase family 99-like domain-containing protein [Bacteroidales bacterium]|nr:glycoside hydrolase family 99-like domain-containing protein [Bacteroidales bacterium]